VNQTLSQKAKADSFDVYTVGEVLKLGRVFVLVMLAMFNI
jgi:hypothetical protein